MAVSGHASQYCSVTFTTTPTYEVFESDRVYPDSTTSGDSVCTLEVNSPHMITITVTE